METSEAGKSSTARVPRHAAVNLFDRERTVQVNYCRNPDCSNYGIYPRTMPGKTGPSAERDPHYKIHSTSRGQVPALLCKICDEKLPIKSNAGIAEEAGRLQQVDGLWTLEERTSCNAAGCPNNGRPIGLNPRLYRKRGRSQSGGRQYECKECHARVSVSNAPPIRRAHQQLAADVFSRIANKSPMRGAVRGAGLSGPCAYYNILNFIERRCRDYSATLDRSLIDGRRRLPERMVIESDAQSYTLNWISRMDRRNADVWAYCSVDSDSRFILGLHGNFDKTADAFGINAESAALGDMNRQEPFRKHARYWLAGDELRAGRSKTFANRETRQALAAKIELLYRAAAHREDVEDIELEHMNTAHRTPHLHNGLLVHQPYTIYAHWVLLRRLLAGAGVEQTQMHFDIDSTARAAYLCSFIEEVKQRRSHGFFVKFDKHLTVDDRRRIVQRSRGQRNAFRDSLPEDQRDDVDLLLMKGCLQEGRRYGKWNDEWFEHPSPTMNEPRKAMCWLTPDNALDEDTVASMYLCARLARVDNVFMLTRRLFSAFERPIGTSSGQNTVWHGYQPYNPAMIQKYLTIFRAVNNFIQVGGDGVTPAMRLGFEKKPLTYKTLLWPEKRRGRPRKAHSAKRNLSTAP